MHQFGIIKKCLDTVDERYKYEDSPVYVQNCATVLEERNQAFWTLRLEHPNYEFDNFRQFRVG